MKAEYLHRWASGERIWIRQDNLWCQLSNSVA